MSEISERCCNGPAVACRWRCCHNELQQAGFVTTTVQQVVSQAPKTSTLVSLGLMALSQQRVYVKYVQTYTK